jgi:hypothetical protein
MPRFHLNLFNNVDALDDEGAEFADLAAAKQIAIAGARELMAAHVMAGKPVSLWHRIEIADDDGKVLATLPFSELITIMPSPLHTER